MIRGVMEFASTQARHPKSATPIIALIAFGGECAMMTASTCGCLFLSPLLFALSYHSMAQLHVG